jgi:peptidoglycan hydrolase-like protein with peptidoglycan-binding domain
MVKRVVAVVCVLVPLAVIVAAAVVLTTSKPSLTADANALATIKLPLGGGKIERVQAIVGAQDTALPVAMHGKQVWPATKVAPGKNVTVIATIKRPGWISWLAGSTQRVRMTVKTPSTKLTSQYVTVHPGKQMKLTFKTPVSYVAYGTSKGKLTTKALPQPQTHLSIKPTATAGTMIVEGAVRSWERAETQQVSWFPSGSKATAFATPKPGTAITAQTPLTITFSKPVSQVLGKSLPPVSPTTAGSWHKLNSRAIRFVPEDYGYGLGANVAVALPSGIQLVGGQAHGSDPTANWTVPAGSTLRLQQLLAMLGYLPVNFQYASGVSVASTIGGEEQAAVDPPKGTFPWRYSNTPSALEALWSPGTYGELTKGAVMAFENSEDMDPDGVAGPEVWKALIQAALKGQKSTFGYTYVHVTEGSPETETTWHDGKTVVSGAVNTGIAAAPTATGVFAVFEHLSVTTMSGLNPDGTPYHDPGIPWVSYFNGGDALHGFIRASYGFPQSLGCVEMPFSEAGQVYPYTPIGTIVNVVS